MATLGASMVTLLTDNWAGAGAAPTFGFLLDYRKELADTTEQVLVRLPIHEDVDPINDILSNFKFTMQLRVKTTVSEDRLKVLTDETIRIINTYAITGITRQFAKRGENTSDRKMQVFSYDVWATLEEHASTAGTSYSSPGAGDVVFPADVSIAGDLTVTGTLTTATVAQIDDLLMFGSAIAAWVPMAFEMVASGDSTRFAISGFHISNLTADDDNLLFCSTMPMLKGSLKLYVSGLRLAISDADATNFVTLTLIRAMDYAGDLALANDGSNRTAAGEYDKLFTAVDVSAYETVRALIYCETADANALDISSVSMRCYYA